LFQRFRKFAQTTTYLGMAVIFIVWCVVIYLTYEEHQRAYEDGVRQGSNLARIFQEYISRVVGGADTTLKALRESYQRDPQHFDIAPLTGLEQSQDNQIVQFGVVGTDGFLKLGTQSIGSAISVADRNFFRVQADAKTDELYIGTPLVGRLSQRAVFVLARRLTARNGSFDGVIIATIDILRLQEFYNSIDIGPGGSISLAGFDGIIRARGGRNFAQDLVGKSFAHTKLFSLFRQAPTGHYWNFEQSTQPIDGVRRLLSYHNVEGFPLIAAVGLAEDDIFEQANLMAHRYRLIAFVLTAAVIGAIGVGARRQQKLSATLAALEQSKLSLEHSKLSLEQSKSSLEQVNLWFNIALKNMVHGLSMFDKDQRLILYNERYCSIYGIERNQIKPGMTLHSILETRLAGSSPEEIDAHVENRVRTVRNSESSYDEIKLRDGRTIAMNFQVMPDGGWVAIHQDITERKRTEAHQELLISELDHRVKNVLARVAVVAKYTRQGSRSMDELIRALDGRIQSMSDAHTLLSQSRWHGVSLGDLVRRQLAPYTTETNTVIGGPDITLSTVATQAVAMVLQELVTNAVKYGSLSTPYGKVSVIWDRRDGTDQKTRVAIAWRETDGPPTMIPRDYSYGANLIRGLIPHELGGAVDLVFAPEGLRCDIEIPVDPRLAS
jgi:PAS domain S-box-containing protein